MRCLPDALVRSAEYWALHNQADVGLVARLNEQGVAAAFFSSSLGEIATRALGVDGLLPAAEDRDLRVPESQFDESAELLGAPITRNKEVEVLTGDGRVMRLCADEATVGRFQFMKPKGPVCIGLFGRHKPEYEPDRRLIIDTSVGPLYLDLLGTLQIYALGQRNGSKYDELRAAVIAAAFGVDLNHYDLGLGFRARHIGRIARFIRRVAAHAAELRPDTQPDRAPVGALAVAF